MINIRYNHLDWLGDEIKETPIVFMTALYANSCSIPLEVVNELNNALREGVRTDLTTRILYSTDASIYQIEPLGVVFPCDGDELCASVEIASKYQIPLLLRGAGSSLAGQAIGTSLIIDTSKYLTKIISIDPDQNIAWVEPGVILDNLNRSAGLHNLMFGPDPASAERATMGGSVANNATGAHSILYGMAADHLISAEVVLADGKKSIWEPLLLEQARQKALGKDNEAALYHAALKIKQECGGILMKNWPKVWRRASGYSINYLLPWSPSQPPMWQEWQEPPFLPYPPIDVNQINLAPLLAGSEGTLAVIKSLTVRLVPKPAAKVLVIKTYAGIIEACDDVVRILESRPSAIELIPGSLLDLARSVPAYARDAQMIPGNPEAVLAVEYYGYSHTHLVQEVRRMYPDQVIAETAEQQRRVWAVRKAGLGLLGSRAGDEKPLAFIEDLSIPVERLGLFVREMERILADHKTRFEIYAHASAGCLHIRPIINLKSISGREAMKTIAAQAVELTLALGGAVSGEHGDGLARSQWLERAFGKDIVDLFRIVKESADPAGLLNPGKILNSPEINQNLRYGEGYRTQPWKTLLDFSPEAGIDGAIELCNGAGVCRKFDGVMCPSFQATREEIHSTRGRANLLRALISGGFSSTEAGEQAVYSALDLCLACKGCKAECPSSVDIAKLKYEFSHHYHITHPRKTRDFIFGYIDTYAPAASLLAPLSNRLLKSSPIKHALEKFGGISSKRVLPMFARKDRVFSDKEIEACYRFRSEVDVLVLSDTFSCYLHPETITAALRVLLVMGRKPFVLPHLGAGRTLISKGFLPQAKNNLRKLIAVINKFDPEGSLPVVGIEPSEIYTLHDELFALLKVDHYLAELSQRAWGIDEYLLRDADYHGLCEEENRDQAPKVLLHGHCYQKARTQSPDGQPVGVLASQQMLEEAGFDVQVIDSGCCGMAGAFGYEAEHYDISVQVGELSLFPAIRNAAQGSLIAAPGTSCRTQIKDGTGLSADHPIVLVARMFGLI